MCKNRSLFAINNKFGSNIGQSFSSFKCLAGQGLEQDWLHTFSTHKTTATPKILPMKSCCGRGVFI